MNIQTLVTASLFSAGCLHKTYTIENFFSPKYNGIVENSEFFSPYSSSQYKKERYDTDADGRIDTIRILNIVWSSPKLKITTIQDFDLDDGGCARVDSIYKRIAPDRFRLVEEKEDFLDCDIFMKINPNWDMRRIRTSDIIPEGYILLY